MAKRAAKPGVTVSRSCASRLEARHSGGHGGNAVAQSEFPLFRRETRRCSIECGRPPAAFGIYYLSSLRVRAPSAHQGLRQNWIKERPRYHRLDHPSSILLRLYLSLARHALLDPQLGRGL